MKINFKFNISCKDIITYLLSLHFCLLYFNYDSYFGLGNSFIIYILVFIISLFIIIKKIKNVLFNKVNILCLFLVLLSIIIYFAIGGDDDILSSALLFFSIIFCINSLGFNYKQKKFIAYSYIFSSVLLSIILLLQQNSLSTTTMRYTIFYSSTNYYDVNFLATYLTIPTVLLFVFVYEKRINKIYILCFIINLLAILLTGSRAGLFMTLAFLLLYLICFKKITLKKAMFLIIGVMILFLGIFFIPESILSHLSEGIFFQMNSRRGQDWFQGLNIFLDSPIIGNGLYATRKLIIQKTGKFWLTAHNAYITYLIYYGIVGFIPIIYIITKPIHNFFKRKITGLNMFFYLLYVGFLIQIMFLEAGFSDMVLITVIVFYLLQTNNKDFWTIYLCNKNKEESL